VCYSLPLLLFALIPILNLLTVLLTALLWLLYELAYRVYTKNSAYGINPFQHMIPSPQICAKYAVNNVFLSVPPSYCQDKLNLVKRMRPDGKVNVMFYNAAFWRFYTAFARARWVHLGYLMLTIGCCGVSLVVLYPLCGLDVLNTGRSLGLMS
jgi:hypothetical protein